MKDGQVDYRALKADRELLDRYVISLGDVEPEAYDSWSEREKIAFWLNAYNAVTLKVVIDHYPIEKKLLPQGLIFPLNSIQQIPGQWKGITHRVLGEERTLDEIEHQILRKRFNEPRIHMALVCAARGCPPLRPEPYVAGRLDAQLNDQTRRFLSNPLKFQVDWEEGIVELSPIFKWFGEDFLRGFGPPPEETFGPRSDTERAVLAFVAGYMGPEKRQFLRQGNYRIRYLGYDWSLNEREPAP